MVINLRDSYTFYTKRERKFQESVDVEERQKPISCKIYLKVVGGFIQFIIQKLLAAYDVRLYGKLGIIGIRGKKVKPRIGEDGEIKGAMISWGKTFQLWKTNPEAKANKQVIYCLNEHSDGIRYKLVWHKRNVTIKNKLIYSLRFARPVKRELYRRIHAGQEYLVTE